MNCYICKKEITEKSTRYIDSVCDECDEKFEEIHEKVETFRKQYRIDHAACPKCNSTTYMSTLAGFIMIADKLDEYKDLNDCTCSSCGDKHIIHERVPVNESK